MRQPPGPLRSKTNFLGLAGRVHASRPCLTMASRRRLTASAPLPLSAAPDAQRSALYSSLKGMNGAMDFPRLEERMEPLGALPERLNARRAVPLTGEATTQLGHAADALTQPRRSLRRVAAGLPRIHCLPRVWCAPHVTRALRRRSSRHGEEMATPGNHAIERSGMQPRRRCLQPSLLELSALCEPPAAECSLPAAPRPWPHRTRTGAIPHGEAREPQPCTRLRALGRCDLLRRDGRPCARWSRSSWAPGLLQHALRGCPGDRALPRGPRGGARHGKREAPPRRRLTPGRPHVTMLLAFGQTAMVRGPDEPCGSCLSRTAPGVHTPRVDSACPIGPVHHQRGRTGRLDLTGERLPFEPPLTLLLLARLACVCLGDRRLWALPPRGPEHAAGDTCRGHGHRRMPQILRALFHLHGAQARWGLGRAILEQGRIVPQQPHVLRLHPCSRRLLVARQHLLQPTRRIVQQAISGYGCRPAMASTGNTSDGRLTQTCSKRRQSLAMPRRVPRTRCHFCCDPRAHRPVPSADH